MSRPVRALIIALRNTIDKVNLDIDLLGTVGNNRVDPTNTRGNLWAVLSGRCEQELRTVQRLH